MTGKQENMPASPSSAPSEISSPAVETEKTPIAPELTHEEADKILESESHKVIQEEQDGTAQGVKAVLHEEEL